jgi:anti-sigma factor (TIGR02949 family)
MDCQDIRPHLLDHQRGRLAAADRDRVAAHLATCEACRRAAAVEAELSDLLERRLPVHAAPLALKRRLAARLSTEPEARPAPARRPWMRRIAPPLASALAAAALVLVSVRAINPGAFHPESPTRQMAAEGVNDHLRVVQSTHPVEIESGGIHQVKPWFTGRLDFAPRVDFSGDAEFPLVGGSVGYYRDRKAAVFVFRHELHTISLLVFRADGLPWPTRGLRRIGRLDVDVRSERGFSVLLWRDGELGYCLVSDVSPDALERLATRVAGDGP